MPYIDTDSLIREYWNKNKDKYTHIPGMDYDKFERICKTPFHYIKDLMQTEEMPIIMVKGLGKFVVLSTQIKNVMLDNRHQFKFRHRTEEQMLEIEKNLKVMYDRVKADELERKLNREDDTETEFNIIEE